MFNICLPICKQHMCGICSLFKKSHNMLIWFLQYRDLNVKLTPTLVLPKLFSCFRFYPKPQFNHLFEPWTITHLNLMVILLVKTWKPSLCVWAGLFGLHSSGLSNYLAPTDMTACVTFQEYSALCQISLMVQAPSLASRILTSDPLNWNLGKACTDIEIQPGNPSWALSQHSFFLSFFLCFVLTTQIEIWDPREFLDRCSQWSK